ncbi:TPA: hypothetical protein QDC22_007538 [Burkholderia stabilis]|nr:hypothetical protein [Burkholderia stabilis]HDR9589149.1 hypothetical protein [Burkholderia stabilis]HDR9649545.1 hypothetical protein [Burkholderia stabilis]HDR9653611.1 hypothetical protein [Burkholderia stabilis]HDR9656306.1 hypothetical protein [Burkholderia stabilis]
MELDREIIITTIGFFGSVVLPIGSAVYTWIATRDKDNAKHISAVETVLTEQIAKLNSRMDQAEAAIRHSPNSTEISGLKADLRALEVQQEATLREMKGMRTAVDRIEDYLLKK